MMKKITALVLSALLSVGVLCSCKEAPIEPLTPNVKNPDPKIVESGKYGSMTEFSSEFAKISADDVKNTLVSPASAYFALAMIKEGAKGNTLAQMSEVMGDASGEDMYSLISHLTTLEKTTLNIANSIWLDTEFEPKQAYIDALASYYLAEAFRTHIPTAEKQINTWIEDKTNKLIKNMLSEDALDDCIMALVNTIYMDAEWQSPFEHNNTHKRSFRSADGTVTDIDFMYNDVRSELVIDEEKYEGVVLPYKDGSLRFIAIMPKDDSVSTKELISLIAEDGGYGAVADNTNTERIRLRIPKFELEYSASLKDALMDMGMVDAFTPYADFSGIAPSLMVDEILQNAVLKLDEEGTEAAAATVIMYKESAALVEEVRALEFNRPFTFAVVDSETDTVLFCGQYNKAE